jgi:hypothetical protein
MGHCKGTQLCQPSRSKKEQWSRSQKEGQLYPEDLQGEEISIELGVRRDFFFFFDAGCEELMLR